MNICIIPARGGSKRIPKKNIKLFNGLPSLVNASKLAYCTKIFDKILVSTEDQDVIEVCNNYDLEVIQRPNVLGDDHSTTYSVMLNAIDQMEEQGIIGNFYCCLYPVTPLLLKKDLIDSLEIVKKLNQNYVFAISEFSSSIYRSLSLKEDNATYPVFPQYEFSRTQDLDVGYFDAGQFYWASEKTWRKSGEIHSNGVGYKIPKWRAVDIDDEDDWKRAEILSKIIK